MQIRECSYLSYKEEVAATVWSATRTSYVGKMNATACLPVEGILFSFMAGQAQWLNSRVHSSPVDLFSSYYYLDLGGLEIHR